MRIDIESRVITHDRRHVGKVTRVVIDPKKNRVIALIVHRHRGLLDIRDIVVPVTAVARTSGGEVHVHLTAEELERLPDFIETDYIPPPPEWFTPAPFPPGGILWPAGYGAVAFTETERQNVPEGSVTLAEGTEVYCPEGRIGVVDEVISDSAGQAMQGFIIRRGALAAHRVFIPIEWVAQVTPDRVLLSRTKPEIEHLAERAKGES